MRPNATRLKSPQITVFKRLVLGCSLFLGLAMGTAVNRAEAQLAPSGKGYGLRTDATAELIESLPNSTVTTGNGINYHGGPIMPGTVKFYFIWYGNWVNGPKASDSPGTVALLQGLFAPNVLGGSGYALINSTYGDTKNNISGNFSLAAAASDAYSLGKRITDANLKTIIANAISSKALPLDPAG